MWRALSRLLLKNIIDSFHTTIPLCCSFFYKKKIVFDKNESSHSNYLRSNRPDVYGKYVMIHGKKACRKTSTSKFRYVRTRILTSTSCDMLFSHGSSHMCTVIFLKKHVREFLALKPHHFQKDKINRTHTFSVHIRAAVSVFRLHFVYTQNAILHGIKPFQTNVYPVVNKLV